MHNYDPPIFELSAPGNTPTLTENYVRYHFIRAPFSGVVIARSAQQGEYISPQSAGGAFTRTGLCTIVDSSSIEGEVEVRRRG